MNFLNELDWVRENSGNKGSERAFLVSNFTKAPCDLLVIPKSRGIEYRVEFLNKHSSPEKTEFMNNEGYIIPRDSVYSISVKWSDSAEAPSHAELASLGFSVSPFEAEQSIDVWDAPIGAFSLTPYLCGLKIRETVKENMRAISPFGEYGHQSMTVFKNGKGYTAFTANSITMKEYDENTFSRLAVYDIDEPQNAHFYTVAAKGVNGNIRIDGVSSLVSIVDAGENLVFNCYGFVNGVITEFQRVFDPETETFGELRVCKILKDGVSHDFTNENIAKLFGAEYGLTKIEIEMGVGPYFKYEGEWYTWLFTGSKRFSGILLKTVDFLNFEFVMIPEECRGTKCEIISYLFGEHLYVAFRREYLMQRLEVVKYDMKTLKPLERIVLKDTAMRPYFYEYNGELYLIHSPHARHYTSIVKLSTERRFLMSRCVASIENFHMCTPCALMHEGELYLTFSARHGSYSQIFISHFSPEMPYTEEEVNGAFLKFMEKELK